MNPAHVRNLSKFMKKYRHIRGQQTPNDRSFRAICMGLDHLISILRKEAKNAPNEYLRMTYHWLHLLDDTKKKSKPQVFDVFVGQISLKLIDFVMLYDLDKTLLNHALNVWANVLKIEQQGLVIRFVTENMDKLQNFVKIFFQLGNYYTQFLAVEVLVRFLLAFDSAGRQNIVDHILAGDNLESARRLLTAINLQRFDIDARVFLNAFNDSFEEWSVFSICADYGRVENYNMVQPTDNGHSSELWIDFNFRDYSVTFFCDGKTFAEQENQWVFIEIERKDMQDVSVKKVANHLELTVFLNEKTGLITGEKHKHKFQKVMFGVALNDTTAMMVNHILPLFTGIKFQTYNAIVMPEGKGKSAKPVRRNSKTKTMKKLAATAIKVPTIVEEDSQSPATQANLEMKTVVHLFEPTQKTIDYSALLESMSNYTYDDATTNFGTIEVITSENEDEIIDRTQEPIVQARQKPGSHSVTSNKENVPPQKAANEQISSTVHLDDSDGPPELVPQIAYEYEYDTGEVDDLESIIPPTELTLAVKCAEPRQIGVPREEKKTDMFDLLVEDSPEKQPTTSRNPALNKFKYQKPKTVQSRLEITPENPPKNSLLPKKRGRPLKNTKINVKKSNEAAAASPPKKAKPSSVKSPYTALGLLTQVLKERTNKPTDPIAPSPQKLDGPVNLNMSMMENNWLMKKFIDSSFESISMTDPNQEIDSVSNFEGVSEPEPELEPFNGLTYTKSAEATSRVERKVAKPPESVVAAATSKQTRQVSVSKRTYDDSGDLLTTEIFEKNIKRTKFSTPKVFVDPPPTNQVVQLANGGKGGSLVAVGNELQIARQNLNDTFAQMSSSFLQNINDSNASLNAMLADTTRAITESVTKNAHQLNESYKRFREMRAKEEKEMERIKELNEANRQLASKCKEMTDKMIQKRDDRLRLTHIEFNEMTKSFLTRSGEELNNQWSLYKKNLVESMKTVLNNMLAGE